MNDLMKSLGDLKKSVCETIDDYQAKRQTNEDADTDKSAKSSKKMTTKKADKSKD